MKKKKSLNILMVLLILLSFMFIGCEQEVEEKLDMTEFNNCPTIRFSSFNTGSAVNDKFYLKSLVPYDDTYRVKTDETTSYKLYDGEGKLIVDVKPNTKHNISLKKDQIVYGIVECVDGKEVTIDIMANENKSVLPYDPINLVDGQSLLDDKKVTTDPLKPAEISYKKREGGLYINCNNPEKLDNHSLNKALTRTDISNKEVFFTFEHNNAVLGPFYYGYQVINRGTEDIYVTVKNIGYHLDGPGCWLGEKEWIDFYNTRFEIANYSDYNDSQRANFEAFFGFGRRYQVPNNQPITYRIPAGEYFYVMGGTTADAYNKINVFGTANDSVSGGCSNGAVLFEVHGENVEGCFYAYKKASEIGPDNKTHQGYCTHVGDHEVGRQYVGWDYCHGVVDCNLTWEFNDFSKSQDLQVKFTNYYKDGVAKRGEPYSQFEVTPHIQTTKKWYTHLNPNDNNLAVGTDMTKYYTVNSNGEPMVIDYDRYDGLGYTANIGNWMIDYMDNYTFVNHGSKDRTIKLEYTNTGSLAIMVRDQNGKVIKGTPQYTVVCAASQYGQEIRDYFYYEVVIPANSYVQFTVEYNLLANSSGNVGHLVNLK